MAPAVADDPLHTPVDPSSYWSTTNLAEAYPGILTPLDWSVVGPATERGTRRALRAIGALAREETAAPSRAEDQIFGVFHGRIASRIDFFYRLGGLMPGTTPEAVVDQIFGVVPDGLPRERSMRRYPVIAARFPATFALAPRRSRAMRARTRIWWAEEISRMPARDGDETRAAFVSALARLTDNLTTDGIALLAGAQPLYDRLSALAAAAGVDPGPLMSGYGSHEETAVVTDIWRCSRGEMPVERVLAAYGYHGPREGVPSGRSWREDPTPLHDLVEAFKALGDEANPAIIERGKREARLAAEAALMGGLPRGRREAARLVLRLAQVYLPLRSKSARTQALDVIRAAARRLGQVLADDGLLSDPDDVMFLTADELAAPLPAEVMTLVATRRARFEECRDLELPSTWRGEPTPVPARGAPSPAGEPRLRLHGVGASSGCVEGTVKVLSDPAQSDDVEPGDILVARTTDPSWAPVMFLASALVVDIGGLMSHAAVIARELGVPCVMGTGTGTTTLRSGDRCRVDGSSGVVEILTSANAAEPT